VKLLRPEWCGNDAVIARFEREAREAANLQHPGIVHVADLGRDERGLVYLVMELLEGRSVGDFAERRGGRLPCPEVAWIAVEALDALAVAHERGLVHRDLKPDNLFIAQDARADWVVKVLDFGIAKAADDREKLTATGMLLGTPWYMSPEQILNSSGVDARADIYAMGATMYHLLTGQPPVDGGSIYDVVAKVSAGNVARDPSSVNPDVPRWLGDIVARALALDPGARFASALEMKAALERDRASLVKPQVEPAFLVAPPVAPPPMQVPPLAPTVPAYPRNVVRRSRKLLVWSVAGAAVLLAGTATAVLVYSNGSASPAPSAAPASDHAMVNLPAGSFWVGSDASGAPENWTPRVQWTVGAFAIDAGEVTVAEFLRCVGAGQCQHPATDAGCNATIAGRQDYPVNCVDWDQAVAYCKFVGKRLPSEAEWEWAARGGKPELGKEPEACLESCPVYQWPEGNGLYGFFGNVEEWTVDRYGNLAPGSPLRDDRVVRSAAVRGKERAHQRSGIYPGTRSRTTGFRCAAAK
jgi:formylglycine-generating enzyme required for sulfatase activity